MKKYRLFPFDVKSSFCFILLIFSVFTGLGIYLYFEEKSIIGLCLLLGLAILSLLSGIIDYMCNYQISDEEKVVDSKFAKRKTIIYWANVTEVYTETEWKKKLKPDVKFNEKYLELYIRIKDNSEQMISVIYTKENEEIIRKLYKGEIKGLDDLPE